MLSLLLIIEVIAGSFISSKVIQAVVLAATIMFALLTTNIKSFKFTNRKNLMIITIIILLLSLAGLYATSFGFLIENNPLYILSDFYHWFFELILTTIISLVWLNGRSNIFLIKFIIKLSLLTGIVGMINILLGLIGFLETGGHIIPNNGLWRMEITKTFPVIILIFLTGTYLYKNSISNLYVILRRISLVLLLVCLFFTFKRTMWLLYFITLFILFLPLRVNIALFMGSMFTILLIVIFPDSIDILISYLNIFTYNASYSVADTLSERYYQLTDVFTYLLDGWSGYGFGAEFTIYDPLIHDVDSVHYIHNVYFSYLLHFGWIFSAIIFLIFIHILFKLAPKMNDKNKQLWQIKSIFSAIVVLLFSAFLLMSTHSLWTGVLIAWAYNLIYMSNNRIQKEIK